MGLSMVMVDMNNGHSFNIFIHVVNSVNNNVIVILLNMSDMNDHKEPKTRKEAKGSKNSNRGKYSTRGARIKMEHSNKVVYVNTNKNTK